MSNNGKIILLDEAVLNTFDDTTDRYYLLTDREATMLLSQVDFFSWQTRWVNLTKTEQELQFITSEIADKLMNGVDNVPIDCDEVEACIQTSLTIAGMQTGITNNSNSINNLQSQITANDSDISALQSQDTILQGAITANSSNINSNASDISGLQTQVSDNDSDISALQTVATDLQGQITANDADILTNAGDISINSSAINQNNTELIDHENRISILENAPPSGGGGGNDYEFKPVLIKRFVEEITLLADALNIDVAIPQGFKTVILRIELYGDDTSRLPIRMFGNKNESNAMHHSAGFGSASTLNYAVAGYIPQITAHQQNVPSDGEIRIKYASQNSKTFAHSIYAMTNANGDALQFGTVWCYEEVAPMTDVRLQVTGSVFKAGSKISVFTEDIEEIAVKLPPPVAITFDNGGLPYTLDDNSSSLAIGILSGGGLSGSNCYQAIGSITATQWVSVIYDAGAVVTYNDFDMYFWTTDDAPTNPRFKFILLLDGVEVASTTSDGLWVQNVWHKLSDTQPLPPSAWTTNIGQVLEIRMYRSGQGYTNVDYRMDDIEIGTI